MRGRCTEGYLPSIQQVSAFWDSHLALKHDISCRIHNLHMHNVSALDPAALERVPRQVVESPSMEIFTTHLDACLCDLL